MLEHVAEARDFNGTHRNDKEVRVVDTSNDKLVVIDNLEAEESHLRQASYLSQEPEDVNRLGHTAVQARRVAGCKMQNVRRRTS